MEITILSHGERYAGNREHGAFEQHEVGNGRGCEHCRTQTCPSYQAAGGDHVARLPQLPVAEGREAGGQRADISCDGEWNHDGQSEREIASWILDLFDYGGELFVSGVRPKGQRESDTVGFAPGFAGGKEWLERI